jgi:hypothetical protein
MMLCARGSERFFKDSSKFLSAKDELRVYCETNRLLEWSRFPVSPLSVDGSLRCWSENEITADNFLCVQYDNMYAEKCHVDSVATACLDFDPIAKKLKTCCRMYGFVWGIKRFNMLQSSRNIEDARRDLNLDAVAEVAQLRRRLAKYETV